MYRLTNEVCVTSVTGGSYTNAYEYDKVGNRLKKLRITSGNTTTITNLFNETDQLLKEVTLVAGAPTETNAYAYDLNGSLIARTNVSATTTVTLYGYNLANKLSSVTTQGSGLTNYFTYNDQGIRVRTDSSSGGDPTLYLVDANNHTGYAQVLEELTALGATPTRSYVISDDVLAQAGSTAQYLFYDGHGSTRQVADSTGVVTSRYNYDAYGISASGSTSQAETGLLYCGEQYDSTLAMYNLRARFYDPSSGRFTARDTFDGNNQDPQSLHKYAYCHGDPVNRIDPSGHFDSFIGLLATVMVAMMISAQYANAPGFGDKGLWNNDEVEVALAFIEGQFLAVPVQYVGRLLVGKVGRAFSAMSRYAGSRLSSVWRNVAVHHATTTSQSILKGIDPARFNPASRFGRAFYVAEEGGTAIAEAVNVSEVIRFELNLGGQAVLDLTNPAVAAEWGYVASSGRKATQDIAERAIQEGYTVIKFYSIEVPGSVNYAVFENFEHILTPREVIPVPWSTSPPIPATSQ
jgi:RHS repeat-associated protein